MIPKEKLKELMDDEQKGFEEYKKLGLNSLARDEKRHYNYLKRLLNSE